MPNPLYFLIAYQNYGNARQYIWITAQAECLLWDIGSYMICILKTYVHGLVIIFHVSYNFLAYTNCSTLHCSIYRYTNKRSRKTLLIKYTSLLLETRGRMWGTVIDNFIPLKTTLYTYTYLDIYLCILTGLLTHNVSGFNYTKCHQSFNNNCFRRPHEQDHLTNGNWRTFVKSATWAPMLPLLT